MAERDTRAVIEDHLARRTRGDLEGDLAENYAPDLIVLCKDGTFSGLDGIRSTAGILGDVLPGATFTYPLLRTQGDYALLVWNAKAANGAWTCHGADSFVVRNGRIVCQTIHYEVGG